MPILDNPRHERFAQGLAQGKSASEAHEHAGYSPNRGNAITLKQQESIQNRVAELLAERDAMARKASQRAADSLAIDREWVLAQLRENALQAAAQGDYGPSNRALELIGKEVAAMFVDRKHVEVDGELRGISDAALIALLQDSDQSGVSEESGPPLAH